MRSSVLKMENYYLAFSLTFRALFGYRSFQLDELLSLAFFSYGFSRFEKHIVQ